VIFAVLAALRETYHVHENDIAKIIVCPAFQIHVRLGPGDQLQRPAIKRWNYASGEQLVAVSL
jgi:hypothetical protein